MKLTQHPEYRTVYLPNQEVAQRCQQVIARWKGQQDIIPVPGYALEWTYESARLFVSDLAHLFQEYNRVLWNYFHYCRQCGGQCCVRDASDVRPFDLLALALLEQSTPVLPDTITAQERACIYLANRRCSWPDSWRTIKCWSFYCLGTGPWKEETSLATLHEEVANKLRLLVHELLPDQLRRYEAVHGLALSDYLDDPVEFSARLHDALSEIFVKPLNAVYPSIHPGVTSHRAPSYAQQRSTSLFLDDQVLTFIAEAAEQLLECPPPLPEGVEISPEQVLEDLERLQWIIEGHPSQALEILKGMYSRYANVPAPTPEEEPAIWYRMRDYLARASQIPHSE